MFQPFEPKHIKRYLMFYGGVVFLMIAFYVINTLFNPVETHEPKVFKTQPEEASAPDTSISEPETPKEPGPFKLLPKE